MCLKHNYSLSTVHAFVDNALSGALIHTWQGEFSVTSFTFKIGIVF